MEPRLSFLTPGVTDLERAPRIYQKGLGLARLRSPLTEKDAAAAGGRIVKPGQPTDCGGYAGYFADLDGFLWEVAWNPRFPQQ